MKSYVNLHAHTPYSFLDGHGRIDKYMERAAKLGMPALAITDHGNIHGWLDFYDAAKATGITPILGLEAYQARKTRLDVDEEERAGPANDSFDQRGPYHLTLLARNGNGYRNLIKLSSEAYLSGYYVKPRLDRELLAEHADGLIILSGCLNGAVQQSLLRDDQDAALEWAGFFQDIVGPENFFVEIQDHGLDEQARVREGTLEVARKLGARVVPTLDCHYVEQADAKSHDLMLCVSTNATVDQENRFHFTGDAFYLQSYEEMASKFPAEWLTNTLLVAESMDLSLSFGELHFPEFALPVGEEELEPYFEGQVWEGLHGRYGETLPDEVTNRAEHELRVIKAMGFPNYFLIVADLTRWADEQGIARGPGRGSAAGSIASYALGITGLDPLRFGLLFERFLVEGRKSMPDIDLDFDDRQRERVIDYAREKYGSDRVANIATFSEVGAKSAIRDAARVLGYDYSTGDRIAKLVPQPKLGVSKTLEESVHTVELAKVYRDDLDAQKIIDAARGLEGLYRQSGIHAAGVVISQSPTTDFVPVMRKGEGKPIVTQWDMDRVEQCGQLKIDFLGLRNLGVIDLCVAEVLARHDVQIVPELIPLDDELTFRTLCSGHSQGVFQLESSGMREMMLALQPSSIEDLMALISLYRPGPLGSGLDKLYIGRKHGRIPVTFEHPKLEEVLASSYGVMLYQEDVLAVARHLAGFSAGEADDLRKAIGKKQMDKIGKFREAFVDGCATTSDVPAELAEKIYTDIEFFGGYGFNRAHAASYALISYWTGYLKAHYPAEYMAGLLSSVADNKERAAAYLAECRRLGIQVSSPDINSSGAYFRVLAEDHILFGLRSIDGLGPSVVDLVIGSRAEPYRSMYDFFRRCPPELLHRTTIDHLVAAGALDTLAPAPHSRVMTRSEKSAILERERQRLASYVSEHPLATAGMALAAHVTTTVEALEEMVGGESVTLGGVLSALKPLTTKRGDPMFRFTLEDLTGSVDAVVFPRDARRLGDQLHEGDIILAEGRLSKEGDDERPVSKLLCSDVKHPNLPEHVAGEAIILTAEAVKNSMLCQLTEVIEKHPGDSPVYIEIVEGRHLVVLRLPKPTALEATARLRQIIEEHECSPSSISRPQD